MTKQLYREFMEEVDNYLTAKYAYKAANIGYFENIKESEEIFAPIRDHTATRYAEYNEAKQQLLDFIEVYNLAIVFALMAQGVQ